MRASGEHRIAAVSFGHKLSVNEMTLGDSNHKARQQDKHESPGASDTTSLSHSEIKHHPSPSGRGQRPEIYTSQTSLGRRAAAPDEMDELWLSELRCTACAL